MHTNNNFRIIGVDAGYGNIKTANTCFPTGLIAYDHEPIFTGNILEYQGRIYRVGEGHKAFVPDKTGDEEFYLLTLAAIANEMAKFHISTANVQLALGLPLTWTSWQREGYRSYMMSDPDVSFRFNDVDYHIHFVGCNVFPQGYAAIVPIMDQHPEKFDGTVVMADIGNGTMNTLFLEDGEPDENRSFTDELGVKQCVAEISKSMMNSCGINIGERQIQQVLQKGNAPIDHKYLDMMTGIARNYVRGLFDTLRQHGYDSRMMRLIIVGGGGVLVKNFGDYDADRTEIIDDICANAKGFEWLAQGLIWDKEHGLR